MPARRPDPRWSRLHALARRQGGAFTIRQAASVGISNAEVRTLGASGQLIQVQPRVWASAWAPSTPLLAEHAALLRLGPRSALSHLSAGAFHTVASRPGVPWLSIPTTHRAPTDGSMRVFRTRHLDAVAVTDGRRVTSVPRTIVDLAQCLPDREVAAALLTVLQRGSTTKEAVEAALLAAGPHYPGSARVRLVVAEFDVAFESILGAEIWELLRDHVPGLCPGFPVSLGDGNGRVCDLALPGIRLDVEADSWAWHGSKAQQAADKVRDRALAGIGWQTLRFTTEEIRAEPQRVIRDVLAVVKQRWSERAA